MLQHDFLRQVDMSEPSVCPWLRARSSVSLVSSNDKHFEVWEEEPKEQCLISLLGGWLPVHVHVYTSSAREQLSREGPLNVPTCAQYSARRKFMCIWWMRCIYRVIGVVLAAQHVEYYNNKSTRSRQRMMVRRQYLIVFEEWVVGVMGIPTGRPMLRHAYTLISIPMSSFAMALRGGYDYMKVPLREATHTSGNVIFTFFCDERKRTQRSVPDAQHPNSFFLIPNPGFRWDA